MSANGLTAFILRPACSHASALLPGSHAATMWDPRVQAHTTHAARSVCGALPGHGPGCLLLRPLTDKGLFSEHTRGAQGNPEVEHEEAGLAREGQCSLRREHHITRCALAWLHHGGHAQHAQGAHDDKKMHPCSQQGCQAGWTWNLAREE